MTNSTAEQFIKLGKGMGAVSACRLQEEEKEVLNMHTGNKARVQEKVSITVPCTIKNVPRKHRPKYLRLVLVPGTWGFGGQLL